VATFLLLFVGGLVTSTGSGLAVPDWPTTFGSNMFLYPWSQMIGGIFYEHSHRLLGSLVGFLMVLLAASLWYSEPRQWVRNLGLVALAAVVLQGILGGLRVVLLQQTLAIIHACFAQAFFALVVCLAVFTSAEWHTPMKKKVAEDAGRVQRLGVLTAGFIYLQLIFGAILRHTGAWETLHFMGAALVAIHVGLLMARTVRHHSDLPVLLHSTLVLCGLLVFQLFLGLGAYLGKFTTVSVALQSHTVLLATSHVVVGALMFVTCVLFSLRAYRLLDQQPLLTQQQTLSPQASL
jgi:cytochrome c oxidase assembly protein subunit 15